MKRIATLTFHNTTNYGALLQALALQKKLESLGVDTEVLDYHCRNIEQRENIALPSLEKNIYHYLAKWKDYCVHSRKRKVISDFRDRYMKISDTSYDRSTIHDSIDKYDAFIVGSGMVTYWMFHSAVELFENTLRVLNTLFCFVLLSIPGFRLFHTYAGFMRYASFVDLMRVVYGNAVSLVLVLLADYGMELLPRDLFAHFNTTST